ncbi:MAG: DevC protein [Proteobacteria bacterium ST_bin11]|nr:MAG: DevC protein [Proteobacteria bacterium ST_bin11]
MNPFSEFYFAGRLAGRQLIHEPPKLIAAISGVLFACVLVFMQLGFKDSLYASAASAPMNLDGDLFVLHKQTEAMWRPVQFDRSELMRTLGHSEVMVAYPLYLSLGQFKNIQTHIKRTLMVYGFDPDAQLMSLEEVKAQSKQLLLKDTAIFDESSRPEFGPMRQLLKENNSVTEINDYKIKFVGLFHLGVSFAADGNVVTSDLNFLRIFPNRSAEKIDLGVVRLKADADIQRVKSDLRGRLNEYVNIFTYKELVAYEKGYWSNTAPIGFIFGFGTVMGLVVGMVIVYQILFTDITNHLNEFATLKAMGYRHGYFVKVVFSSAFYLALLGFVPGYFLSVSLYQLAESQTSIPMPMTTDRAITVFAFILSMCATAGLLAVRRLKAANPADMF